MPVDDDTSAALRDARADARKAQAADNIETIHEYGGRVRTTLETIKRNDLDGPARELIEQAIRHAVNAQRAVNENGGRHDARLACEEIAKVLGEAEESSS